MDASTIPLNRLYGELAYLWPLMSPPEEYAEEAAHWRDTLRELLGPGRHEILELGVGGGHNLSHLTADFKATAADISEPMLAHSKRLNPGVEHLLGDMRCLRTGRKFKAVLIHDAISHMLSDADLLDTFVTAAAHLEPGGVLITAPDRFHETFGAPHTEVCTHSNGRMELTCLEYTHDPDPNDSVVETIFTHIIREGSQVRIEHDRMLTGLFPTSVWERLMGEAGFRFEWRTFRLESVDTEYTLLIGRLIPTV